jgi:copper chaperone CopZ
MNQRFKISGMTCENCKNNLLNKLSLFKEINIAKIDLSTGIADLEVTQEISLNIINEQLNPKYKAEIFIENINSDNATESSESKLKQLFPLFLIFGYLIAATFYLQKELLTIEGYMYDFMGLFFIIFSFFKFLDYNGFSRSFAQYDPLAKRSLLYAKIYPFLETVLGILFLMRWNLNIALWVTLVVLSMTTFGVLLSLLKKDEISCACLGSVLKLPMSEVTLIENIIMLIMCVSMLINLF